MPNPAASKNSELAKSIGKINSGRANMLLIFVFSLINIALPFFNNTFFLFSAFIPYYIATEPLAMAEAALTNPEILPPTATDYVLYIAIAVTLTLPFLLCFLFSRKKPVPCFIAALACIVVDTAAMVYRTYATPAPFLVDYLFHGWMIWSMASGLWNLKKLKESKEKAPEPETMPASRTLSDEDNENT